VVLSDKSAPESGGAGEAILSFLKSFGSGSPQLPAAPAPRFTPPEPPPETWGDKAKKALPYALAGVGVLAGGYVVVSALREPAPVQANPRRKRKKARR
jgi:hypothetical protein